MLSVIALEKLPQISKQMSNRLQTNRATLRSFLDGRRELDCYWPEHGTIVFPRLRDANADQLCDFLRAEFEVSVVPGRFFGAPEYFRIGIGGEDATVAAALDQLDKGINAFAK